jgi:hypothetical protein
MKFSRKNHPKVVGFLQTLAAHPLVFHLKQQDFHGRFQIQRNILKESESAILGIFVMPIKKQTAALAKDAQPSPFKTI